ncbi:putative transcriptional regulator [Mucilaginibacter sp. UYNi724]
MLPNEVTIKLGKFLEYRREQLGITEYDFAQTLDESIFYVRQLEQGMIDPEIPELAYILKELDMTMPQFAAAFEDLTNLF